MMSLPRNGKTVALASVLVKSIVKARRALLGTITSLLLRLGNLTKSCWF